MSEMVERVARAIDPERWAAIDGMATSDSARGLLITSEYMRARAAIAEMRIPTEAMLDQFPSLVYNWEKEDRICLAEAWTRAVDVALAEPVPA